MKEIDFIVVGGGISGSLMALQLIEEGCSVVLFDNPKQSGSSHIAAGSINPITGRKFVKSWKIDELIKSVEKIYGAIEGKYGIDVMHQCHIVRGLKSMGMQNDWSARINDSDYADYINRADSITSINGIACNYLDYAIIDKAYRIDFNNVMALVKELNNSLIEVIQEPFDSTELSIQNSNCVYGEYTVQYVVFAEGSSVRYNSIWNYLPFVPAHGERFIIHAPKLKLINPFNDGKIIIPLGNDQYWVGSNYNWDIGDPIKTEKGFQLLKEYLDNTLTVSYEVLNHAGHIRPSTYNRRPFVGSHPEHSNCYILNGMGAKGASLAPYCVEQLIGHILHNAELDEEIDVRRIEQLQ